MQVCHIQALWKNTMHLTHVIELTSVAYSGYVRRQSYIKHQVVKQGSLEKWQQALNKWNRETLEGKKVENMTQPSCSMLHLMLESSTYAAA